MSFYFFYSFTFGFWYITRVLTGDWYNTHYNDDCCYRLIKYSKTKVNFVEKVEKSKLTTVSFSFPSLLLLRFNFLRRF